MLWLVAPISRWLHTTGAYIGQLTDKYSLQDLKDIAVGYMGMDAGTTNVKTAGTLVREMADMALTYRLQEEKVNENY